MEISAEAKNWPTRYLSKITVADRAAKYYKKASVRHRGVNSILIINTICRP
jgi:hypothetical protein